MRKCIISSFVKSYKSNKKGSDYMNYGFKPFYRSNNRFILRPLDEVLRNSGNIFQINIRFNGVQRLLCRAQVCSKCTAPAMLVVI